MPVRGARDKYNHEACALTYVTQGDNNLSFIETSALDASNVELAFQNILTGETSIHTLREYNELTSSRRNLQDSIRYNPKLYINITSIWDYKSCIIKMKKNIWMTRDGKE